MTCKDQTNDILNNTFQCPLLKWRAITSKHLQIKGLPTLLSSRYCASVRVYSHESDTLGGPFGGHGLQIYFHNVKSFGIMCYTVEVANVKGRLVFIKRQKDRGLPTFVKCVVQHISLEKVFTP